MSCTLKLFKGRHRTKNQEVHLWQLSVPLIGFRALRGSHLGNSFQSEPPFSRV